MKIVAILIPVYNNITFTKKALQNLSDLIKRVRDSSFKFISIVIDDGSTDGTSEYIEKNHPEVVILKGDGNLWWSGGINAGARYADEVLKADYLVLWNNDIKADPDYFNNLIALLNEGIRNEILGSKIYSGEKMLWSMGGTFNPYSGRKRQLAYFEKDSPEYEKIIEVDWLAGMGTILPIEVFHKVGLWDNVNFPQYHGDKDYTYRAKLTGFKIKVYPTLKIWNDFTNTGIEHNGSFIMLIKSMKDIKSFSNIKKDLIFYRKYAKSPLAYKPLVVKYFRLVFGFFKWRVLNFFGIRKK